MPIVIKKLKVVDINDNTVVEEKEEESIMESQELTTMKEEIDEQLNKLEKLHDEKGITEKVNNEMNEKIIQENIEIKPEEIKPDNPEGIAFLRNDNPEGIAFRGNDKKKKSAEYMKEYRKVKQEEQKKLKEDLKHKTEIIEKIAVEPKIIEKNIEKEVI